MPDETWQQVKDLFAATLDEPRESRLEYLRLNCDGDERLFAEVKSLLEANDETEQIIEYNGFNLSQKLSAGKNYDFTKFGRYTVLREIGRGGMGAVFLAERNDGEFEQKAALKIIRQGSFVNEEIERHFRRERQILASLNHPNIARLLDGGVSEAGELFLVMEYVEGLPLTEYAENYQLNVEEKLQLFLKICRAVSYAHQNLIVHRDLKPSNILVTADGEPKLLDFGLAKITNDELDETQTQTVLRAFTPTYASPEQIHGKTITTASDVYSLGVVLYELLTNHRPFSFEGKSIEEILNTVNVVEPIPPSSVENSNNAADEKRQLSVVNRQSLAGDLDNITLKALRKEPTRRYKSVEAFAEDIERHQKGLPISARPNTVGYRAAKFFQRNKIAVSATMFVILALISGLAIALWQAKIAERQRARAENRFSDVRQLSNALLFKVAPKIERLEGSIEAREILVNESLKYLDSLASESADDASLQSELASAYEKIGDLQGAPRQPNLSDFSGAVASYEKARTIRQSLSEKNTGGAENRHLLALDYAKLSDVHYWVSNLSSATAESEAALRIFASLTAEQPERLDWKLDAAAAEIEYANIFYFNNQFDKFFPVLQKTLGELESLRQQQPDNQQILALLGKSRRLLASGLSWDDKQPEAEAEMKTALEITERLAANQPNDNLIRQELLRTYWETAGIYEENNNPLSYQYLLKALKISEESVRQDAADTQARENLASTFFRLGAAASNLKYNELSASYLEKSQAIYAELQKAEPKNLNYKMQIGKSYIRFGVIKSNRQDWLNAIGDYKKAAAIFLEVTQIEPQHNIARRYLAEQYFYIAESYTKLLGNVTGEKQKTYQSAALENYRQALDIHLELDAANSLTEYDRKLIEKTQTAMREVQNWKLSGAL